LHSSINLIRDFIGYFLFLFSLFESIDNTVNNALEY
jgi:hypothetical protein